MKAPHTYRPGVVSGQFITIGLATRGSVISEFPRGKRFPSTETTDHGYIFLKINIPNLKMILLNARLILTVIILWITNIGAGVDSRAMSWSHSTRRRVLHGIGVGGSVTLLGSGSAVGHGEENDDDMNDDPDTNEEFAAIRCGHLSPDTPDVDVYLGKTPDLNPTVADLSYPTFRPGPNDAYLEVPAGTYGVAVAPTNSTSPAIEVDGVDLEGGFRYTVLAIGELATATEDNDTESNGTGLQPLVIVDAETTDDATPPDDQAEISFVHASPDAGAVDIEVDGDPILEGVGFGDASDYFAVEPGEYDVSVVADGEEVLTVTRELLAGTSITAHVVGYASPPETDENANEEEDDPEEEVLEELRVVTSLDGTNPLADGVVTR